MIHLPLCHRPRAARHSSPIALALVASFFAAASAFATPASRHMSSSLASSTSAVVDPTEVQASYPQYTPEQLRDALDSLLDGSDDRSKDARHLHGYDAEGHLTLSGEGLSKLQSITAHRILDYQQYMNDPSSPSMESVKAQFDEFCSKHGQPLKLDQVIRSQSPRMALAAEFKRASPSKGDIAPDLNAGDQATIYAQAGANIVSVLTEPRWFLGGLSDLTDVRLRTTEQDRTRPAVLRKEFVTNAYQITEAAARGADTILLIVAVLPLPRLRELIDHARSLGMEALVEVHADAELEVALEAGAKVIGVNNRNLHTFEMDLRTTEHVAEQLSSKGCEFNHNDPSSESEFVLCSLSGMSNAADVDRYRNIGVGMCLIGESLMRASDPAAAIAALCLDPQDYQDGSAASAVSAAGAYVGGLRTVKVCGVTNAEDALVACQSGADLIGVIFVPRSKRCVTAEQATEVVDAVRQFGERKVRASPAVPKTPHASPARQLLACATAVESERRPLVVGVFQNQEPEFVREMVEACGLDMVQLHGQEGMTAANAEACGVPAIRVVDIETDPTTGAAKSDTVDRLLGSLTNDPAAILLDTSIKGDKSGGGTGVTFDWRIAEQIQNAGVPVIVAGGLSSDNVADAVSSVRPWGVDVSSGVERVAGHKDHDKVREFVKNARRAAVEASKGF